MNHPTQRNAVLLAAVLLSLAAAVPTWALCPGSPGSGTIGIFYIDLRFPISADLTQGAVTFKASHELNLACADGSMMAVLQIDIPADCSQANVVVEYDGQPEGWTVDLGDSPSNNGFGGDGGDTDADAELQILDDTLAVYNAGAVVDRLVGQELVLNQGAIRLTVGDQSIGWGQPYGVLATPNLGQLFSIPDAFDGRTVYLGLNRVILDTSRSGCGARRALISFQ